MAVFSKRFHLIEHLPCDVIHPWTHSCSYNALALLLKSFKGSSKFFGLIYLAQVGLKRQHTPEELTHTFVNFLRSCLFGSLCSGGSVAAICFLRWLLGEFTTYTLGLIPGFIGGAAVFFEHPTRLGIDLTLFIALVSDMYLKVYQDEGVLKISLPLELCIFTTCSSLLLYFLRSIPDSYTIFWPFTPHRLPEDPERRMNCPHKGKCLDDIRQTGSTYFCYGLGLQTIKVAAFNFNKLFVKPRSFFGAFFRLRNMNLPLFAGLYVSLFKGVSCLLRRLRGHDEAWHALPAGIVASLCYLIQPNLSLAFFAFSNLSQILCRKYRKKMGLPAWPWEEVTFMICMGLLYHARATYPHCFPSYMFRIMDTVTDGRAQTVYGLVNQYLLIRF